MNINELKFNTDGLIPAIVIDAANGEVLMQAYMNMEALEITKNTGKVTFWSRSRKKMWTKGETSGNFLNLVGIRTDCDGDSLLVVAEPEGPTCHTGNKSCFFNEVDGFQPSSPAVSILSDLYGVVSDRKENPRDGSYTNYLFDKGIDKILKKIGEESSEVIIAAKNDEKSEIKLEVADLLYHLTVMLVEKGVKLEDIYDELQDRR